VALHACCCLIIALRDNPPRQPWSGMDAVVIGRSNIASKPMAQLLC